MTIAFIAGTTAEIIKLAPVIRALEERGDGVELWNTAFHVGGLPATLADLGLPQPAVDLVPSRRRATWCAWRRCPGGRSASCCPSYAVAASCVDGCAGARPDRSWSCTATPSAPSSVP